MATPALPLRHDVTFAYRLTWAVAALLAASSAAGLAYGASVLYDDDLMLPALLGQDAVGLIVGAPLLTVSAWLARRGSTRGLLCWMGALFYVAYFWYFYVVGVRFNALFPIYIAIVSMSAFGVLFLLFALDLDALRDRFGPRMPVRLTGGFLIATAVFFAILWLSLMAWHLAAGTQLDDVSRYVIAIDGVVLLPLAFFGGVWLWQRRPLGFALAGVLLVKVAATFLTLVATTVVSRSSIPPDPLQTSAYVIGFVAAALLLVSCLRSIEPTRGEKSRRPGKFPQRLVAMRDGGQPSRHPLGK